MISVIIPCKNRLNHLEVTFPLVRRMAGEYEIIVVDYNCKMGTASYLESNFQDEKRLKIVKAEVGAQEWNLSHARNLGYKFSVGDALLFIDADTKVKSDFLTKHPLKENEYYTGEWLHCSGCCLVWAEDFKAVRGYNQISGSWGSEDYDLYRRLDSKGLSRKYFEKKSYANIKHHDRIRNEFHQNKDIHVSNEENYQLQQKSFISCIE